MSTFTEPFSASSADPFWVGLVDDAATFPPGDAPLDAALTAYADRAGPAARLVRSLVVRDTDLPQVPEGTPVSVVLTGGAGQVHVFVELPAVDPAYSWLAAADEVAAAELRLKLRTGGLDPDAFPTPERLAAWIDAALDRELPFKCTAGLHRALPHVDADGCAHHGFLTVLAATRVAFDGGSPDDVVSTLRRDDPADLLTLDLAGARRWFTSFGSCSVDEPMADLRELVSL